MLRAMHQFLLEERKFKRGPSALPDYRWPRSAVNKRSDEGSRE
jgi:hypothetical protein